jgi:hypothetical protein
MIGSRANQYYSKNIIYTRMMQRDMEEEKNPVYFSIEAE